MNRIPGTASFLRHPTKSIWQIALLTILTGGIIYILLRPAPPVFFSWMEWPGLSEWLESMRSVTLTVTSLLPGWVVYSLPQGLWALSYTLVMAGIWGSQRSVIAILWLATIPLLVSGVEGLQYIGVIRGTYCLQDMLFGLGGMILGAAIVLTQKKISRYATTLTLD